MGHVCDTHIGSTTALCPPVVSLDDGGEYRASQAQLWMWQCWNEFWEARWKSKKEKRARLYLVINGDVFDGVHHGTRQLWSWNSADWYRAADTVFEKPLNMADRVFVVRGTEIHAGQSASHEEGWASQIGKVLAPSDKQNKVATWWHLDMLAAGVLFDICHHGSLGRLAWTQGNILNRLGNELVLEALRMGRRPPDVAVRAHNHMFDTSGKGCPVKVVAAPAWQLATAYVHKVAPNRLASIGGLEFVCRDGETWMEDVIFKPAARKPWRESRSRKMS